MKGRKSPYANYGYKPPKEGINTTCRSEYPFILAMVEPDSRVLDVGCGGGIFTRFFLDLGAKVTAQDISPVVFVIPPHLLYLLC